MTDNGNQPHNIHLHGCVVVFGGLSRSPEDGDPLSSILNTVSMAVTQSYVRSGSPAARLDRAEREYARQLERGPDQLTKADKRQAAEREVRKRSASDRSGSAGTAVANDGTCPICGVEISPNALGCRSHWRQVKKAKGQAGKIAELARAYDEEQEDD